MSTLLDPPPTRPLAPAAQRLRTRMAAVRVSFTWFGTRKTLTPEQKAQAAESFGAEGEFLSAGKKLLNTRHPAFKAVTTVRGQALGYWKGITLPYPEPGLRLIRQQDVSSFDEQMTRVRSDLEEAVGELNEHYGALREAARQRLGSLYNLSDYPPNLTGLFGIAWEFPSVEPPSYLQQLNPQLFEQEQARVAARFDEAVRLTEQAFIAELEQLVSHLTERLSGEADGKPKVFRDSAIMNLREFFDRFRHFNVRSNEQLDELVGQAQSIVAGVAPQALRESSPLRQRVATQLSGVQAVLDGLLVDRPRRNILRPERPAEVS